MTMINKYLQKTSARVCGCRRGVIAHDNQLTPPRSRWPYASVLFLGVAAARTRSVCSRCFAFPNSEIVERVLCKASRTTSGSDSYFTVRQLFTNSDYLLKSRSERLPPINVEVLLLL